jgi:hypothetical protein
VTPGEVRQRALLRVYNGQDRASICADLGITEDQLSAWELTTSTSELRPPDLPFLQVVLEVPGDHDEDSE